MVPVCSWKQSSLSIFKAKHGLHKGFFSGEAETLSIYDMQTFWELLLHGLSSQTLPPERAESVAKGSRSSQFPWLYMNPGSSAEGRVLLTQFMILNSSK